MTPWCTRLIKGQGYPRSPKVKGQFDFFLLPYFNISCSYDPLVHTISQGEGHPRSKANCQIYIFDHISTYIVPMTTWYTKLVKVGAKVIQSHRGQRWNWHFLPYFNSLGPSDANMRHQIILIFWYHTWIPHEFSIRMNGNMTMIRSLLAIVASKASSSCVLSSWSLAC